MVCWMKQDEEAGSSQKVRTSSGPSQGEDAVGETSKQIRIRLTLSVARIIVEKVDDHEAFTVHPFLKRRCFEAPCLISLFSMQQERGHYFIFFCVLLAIVYVLSRTGTAANCDTPSALMDLGSFDIGCAMLVALLRFPSRSLCDGIRRFNRLSLGFSF